MVFDVLAPDLTLSLSAVTTYVPAIALLNDLAPSSLDEGAGASAGLEFEAGATFLLITACTAA